MFTTAFFQTRMFMFFAGFFFCAALGEILRHSSGNLLWIPFGVLSILFYLWSRRYAEKLKRKVPEIIGVTYSDCGFLVVRDLWR